MNTKIKIDDPVVLKRLRQFRIDLSNGDDISCLYPHAFMINRTYCNKMCFKAFPECGRLVMCPCTHYNGSLRKEIVLTAIERILEFNEGQ